MKKEDDAMFLGVYDEQKRMHNLSHVSFPSVRV
jgi:hypothetical protein